MTYRPGYVPVAVVVAVDAPETALLATSSRRIAKIADSAVGCTYRSETVALWCPAGRWMRKASVAASPNRVQNVCLRECKTNSAGKPTSRTFACRCAKEVLIIGPSASSAKTQRDLAALRRRVLQASF